MWLKFRPTIDNFVDRFKVGDVHIFFFSACTFNEIIKTMNVC